MDITFSPLTDLKKNKNLTLPLFNLQSMPTPFSHLFTDPEWNKARKMGVLLHERVECLDPRNMSSVLIERLPGYKAVKLFNLFSDRHI